MLATGETNTVRFFVEEAFGEAGIALDWQGEGRDEKGLCRKTGRTLVEIDPRYFRPTEVDLLLGDASKARARLGWEPQCSLADMIREMVRSDIAATKRIIASGEPYAAPGADGRTQA